MRIFLLAMIVLNSSLLAAGEYRSLIATSLAVASLKSETPANVKKPKRSECPVCKGAGRVRTGDGLSWTECDACEPNTNSRKSARPEGEWVRVRTCDGKSCRYRWVWRSENRPRARSRNSSKS